MERPRPWTPYFEEIGLIGGQPSTPPSKKETSMKSVETKKELSPGQREELLGVLKARFEKNMNRHKGGYLLQLNYSFPRSGFLKNVFNHT